MKLLLDTHTFLWFINGSPEISKYSRDLIKNETNECFLSIVSLWEISIKESLGKLKLPMSITELATKEVRGNAIELLHITPEHLEALRKLPYHHKDPFDRLIISQSIYENMPILSKDQSFDSYATQRLWHKIK